MKKYKVVVNQIISICFELNANDKKDAERMVNSLISSININSIQLEKMKKEKIKIKISKENIKRGR